MKVVCTELGIGSFSSVKERSTVFRGEFGASRCRWETYRVFFGAQLCHHRTLYCKVLYVQGLKDFMLNQTEHHEKGRSRRLKLLDRVQLQKLSNVEGLEADTAKEGMQMPKKLKSRQTHCVVDGLLALSRSTTHLLFCGHCAFYPIKGLQLGAG